MTTHDEHEFALWTLDALLDYAHHIESEIIALQARGVNLSEQARLQRLVDLLNAVIADHRNNGNRQQQKIRRSEK